MPVAPLKVAVPASAKSSKKGDYPAVKVKATVGRILDAIEACADAEGEYAEAKAELIPVATSELFNYNASASKPASSVKLVDEAGAEVLATMPNKYSSLSDEQAEKLEGVLVAAGAVSAKPKKGEASINDWLMRTIVAKFDSKVFVGADAKFNTGLYTDLVSAIAAVAEKHGVANPLTQESVLVVRPEFHQKRWALGAKVNEQIHEVVNQQVGFKRP
jgi:hypothetical protein